jgi:hypothetical protein
MSLPFKFRHNFRFREQNEILLGNGQGDFTSTLLARSDGSLGGSVGDFNGDGIDDILVANSGQHNEYLWYDPCSDDGYFYDSFTDGCYACPRYTTDTRHSMALCEACPAGTIGPGQSSEARPAVFLRSLRSGQDSCAGRFASSGAPSCEPCPAPLVTNAEGDGATACITLDLMHEMRSRHGRVTRTMGTRRTRRASRVRRARRASKR